MPVNRRTAGIGTDRDEWETPPELFAAVHREFGFGWDMAASDTNAKLPARITREMDALAMPHWPDGNLWINPPYSNTGRWVAKAVEQAHTGRAIVLLIPAATGNRWFHGYLWDSDRHQPRPGVELRFLPKRLRFVGAQWPAPWDSMLIVLRGACHE